MTTATYCSANFFLLPRSLLLVRQVLWPIAPRACRRARRLALHWLEPKWQAGENSVFCAMCEACKRPITNVHKTGLTDAYYSHPPQSADRTSAHRLDCQKRQPLCCQNVVASFLEIDLSKVDSCAIVWQSCIVVCITPDNHTTLFVVDCLHHA